MTTHKKCDTPEYRIWLRMKKSCYSPSSVQYKTYGKKGIRVCEEWLHNFPQFLEDMGPIPRGCKGIELIDPVVRLFCPNNVRWTKDSRGRPKNRSNLPYSKRSFRKPAKVLLTIEHDHLEALKLAAFKKSFESGCVFGVTDIIRDVIKREFPPMQQMTFQ